MVLIIMLLATSFAFAGVPSDVTGESYEAAVEKLMERGIVTGDTDGLFHPEAPVNRAQACVMIVRAMNPPNSEIFGTATQTPASSGFTDMVGYAWAEPYINYAVKNCITTGVGNYKFNPGGMVKNSELITFALRAAGFSDQSLAGSWPENYMEKSKELDLGTGLPIDMPEYVNKWMTGQYIFNSLDLIDKAQKEEPVSGKIVLTGLTYTVGSFDSNLTSFAGKELDKNVAVYSYDLRKNYNKDMELSKKPADYRKGNLYNFKRVTTPAWYLMSGTKVVQIILPSNVGWSGPAYGPINSIGEALNGQGEKAKALDTWTAMRQLTWICKSDITLPTLTAGDGQIYEMYADNGQVRSISTPGGIVKGKHFLEVGSNGSFIEVVDIYNGLVGVTGASVKYFQVIPNASVYVVKSDNTYETGSISSIRKGKFVRMYDISPDENDVDIVIVRD